MSASRCASPAGARADRRACCAGQADIWGYVDAQGVAHFAAEQLDERYAAVLQGRRSSFDTADGVAPLGMRVRRRRRWRQRDAGRASCWRSSSASPNYKAVKPPARRCAQHHAIDYELLQALIATESGFNAQRRVAQGRGRPDAADARHGRALRRARRQAHDRRAS